MKNLYLASAFALSITLAGCGGASIEAADSNPTPHDTAQGPGLFSGNSGNILDAFRQGGSGTSGMASAKIGVNAYLWRAALESVSFMPITQTDSAGGVIITDWYSTPAQPNERVKANVYILGTALLPQNLKLNVFREERSSTGEWTPKEVNPRTVRQLEDTILNKARTLRVQSQS